jgi:hypothetical protein
MARLEELFKDVVVLVAKGTTTTTTAGAAAIPMSPQSSLMPS